METFGLSIPEPKMTQNEVASQLEDNGQKIMGVLHAIHAHANRLIDNNAQRIDKTVKRLYNSVNARLRQNSAKIGAVGQALQTHVDSHLAQNQAAISAATANSSIAEWYRDHMGIPDYTPSPPSPPPFPEPDITPHMPPPPVPIPAEQQPPTCVPGGGGIETLVQYLVCYQRYTVNGQLPGAAVPISVLGPSYNSWEPPAGWFRLQYILCQPCDLVSEIEKALRNWIADQAPGWNNLGT